jgi:hypothetical protein
MRSIKGHKLTNINIGLEKVKFSEPYVHAVAGFFANQPSLDELDLNLNYSNLTEAELDVLFESLSNQHFHSFGLSLRSSGLDNNAMLALASVLSINLQVHNRLSLDLSMNLIFDSEAKELGMALKNFFDLQQLILVLEGCELGDEGFIYFADAILSLENLETLKLNVVKNGLSNSCLATMMGQLNLLMNLAAFELYARNNAWVTNREREELSDAAQNMVSLMHKKIEF